MPNGLAAAKGGEGRQLNRWSRPGRVPKIRWLGRPGQATVEVRGERRELRVERRGEARRGQAKERDRPVQGQEEDTRSREVAK